MLRFAWPLSWFAFMRVAPADRKLQMFGDQRTCISMNIENTSILYVRTQNGDTTPDCKVPLSFFSASEIVSVALPGSIEDV